MKKRYCITLIIIGVIILFSIIILSFNNINMNNALELRVPLLAKKEKTKLQNGDFFNEEEVIKIQLSNMQLKKIEKEIQKNENWRKESLDEKLEEKIKEHTRENIFYQIPDIKNCYWIFTNRSNGVNDKHSIEELLEDKMYYAISLGVLDIDNKTFYYYEFDR